MLEYIRGRMISKLPTQVVLEVSGIGYRLHIPLSTFEKIPDHGEVTVHVRLLIREDQLKIYGFLTEEERDLFQLLLSVNGIGPNTAITILSGSSVSEINNAIIHEDVKTLEKIRGVGKKTAERIILELKGVIKKDTISERFPMNIQQRKVVSDAVMALVSLGYGRSIAEKAVGEAVKKLETADNIEVLVREALKYKT
ncbi:MAG: Holliday junction branch migration protein RuvA [Candidatus Loosdrechtia sp.]|uniref:Holliday junction branch migration protein RuvA n=1 Tax=Candidatus Loosdrechtia sp. TaxID=3101272 RepID=UPI003A6E7FF0|nr:MAG: Holliday junction branch migration protein RuvA [Candidatus Jettenia sp. AMX2]